MIEKSTLVCKVCKLPKVRILAGMYPNGKNKKYLGEDGLQWSGKCCGQCQKERTKNKMKVLRFTRDLSSGEPTDGE